MTSLPNTRPDTLDFAFSASALAAETAIHVEGGFNPSYDTRAWMAFDLTGLSGSVESATLRIQTGSFVRLINTDPGVVVNEVLFLLFDVETAVEPPEPNRRPAKRLG